MFGRPGAGTATKPDQHRYSRMTDIPIKKARMSASARRSASLPWIGAGVFLVAVGIGWYLLPVSDWLSALRVWIVNLGFWGVVIFAVIYAVGAIVLAPEAVLTIAAGFAYEFWAFPIVLVAATIGASLAFLIARYLARDKVRLLLERRRNLAAIDKAVAEEGWKIVGLLRLSPLIPFNLQNYLFGVTAIPFPHFVAATFAGIFPGTALYVYLGVLENATGAGGSVRWAARSGARRHRDRCHPRRSKCQGQAGGSWHRRSIDVTRAGKASMSDLAVDMCVIGAGAAGLLFPPMDIRDNERHRRGTLVFDPVRPRAEFREDLTGPKLCGRSIVMVVRQDPGQQVDDGGVAVMAMHTDMTARRHHRAAETQFAVGATVDFLGEIDRGKHLLADGFIVGRRALLPQNKACGQQSRPSATQRGDMTTCLHP